MKREPLTQEQKESIYKYKSQGHILKEVAKIVGCSRIKARKWWRKGRDNGLAGLQAPKYGTSKKGTLCFFEKIVAEKALAYKRSHPKWGADRVLIELKKDPQLAGLRLPKRRSLATFFKEQCPECVRTRKPAKKAVPPAPPQAAGVHEIWQLDTQEGIRLKNGEIASICNIRDPHKGR